MIQYSQTGLHITVKVDGKVSGTIQHRSSYGFYYVPKGKSKHPDKGDHRYFQRLDDLKRDLEQD